MPLMYGSTTGHLRRCSSKAKCWFRRTQRRMPRQSKEGSINDLVKACPRAKVGVNMVVNIWEIVAVEEDWGKNAVRKVNSNVALSTRARL